MAYKLHELKRKVPSVAGDAPSKPVPPLSPAVQRRLTHELNVNESFLREPGADLPRIRDSKIALAAMEIRRSEQAHGIGQAAMEGSIPSASGLEVPAIVEE
jgi:hypothetical protein